MNVEHIRHRLNKRFGSCVTADIVGKSIVVSGKLDKWEDVVAACSMAVTKKKNWHVVNNIDFPDHGLRSTRLPSVHDRSLEGTRCDVLVVGGGISGASIARELCRYKLSVLLVDKECDLALHASGRNDGEVHPGVDLSRGSLKHKYIIRGNAMYDKVCAELGVPFKRVGQYVCFKSAALMPLIALFALKKRIFDGISDTRVISGKRLHELEPNLNEAFGCAIGNSSSGTVCPYGLTIAYAENAIKNGARVSLSTAVVGMELANGAIVSVSTNRGTIYPRLVINAAGVFSEDVAEMAGDRFFSIHPRRGTNSILDKKAGVLLSSISSIKLLKQPAGHTKGGGIIHTAHDNLLVGPNAVETCEKETTATDSASIDQVFAKQQVTMPKLSRGEIITYFTGVRAATFEEDFIIEKGRRTKNIIHCAGIQSPGLTTAPAVALDVADMAAKLLSDKNSKVAVNPDFDPVREPIPRLSEMDDGARAELIRKNPDYGVIICRCEEISKGEIIDALDSPLGVPTIDGVKKRVRPGMGRCQGGFCMPLVAEIISEHTGIALEEVRKSGDGSVVSYGETKGADIS